MTYMIFYWFLRRLHDSIIELACLVTILEALLAIYKKETNLDQICSTYTDLLIEQLAPYYFWTLLGPLSTK